MGWGVEWGFILGEGMEISMQFRVALAGFYGGGYWTTGVCFGLLGMPSIVRNWEDG